MEIWKDWMVDGVYVMTVVAQAISRLAEWIIEIYKGITEEM